MLKNYIQNGYAINNHKITEQRLFALENDMQFIKSKIKNNSLEFNQNIFFDGQIYDAYSFVNDLLKLAKEEVILIDNYIDDTVFTLFSKYPNINFTIYTSTISKQLKLDFEKYSKQYKNISLKTFKSSHDRFLIIDKKEIYHLGASLKKKRQNKNKQNPPNSIKKKKDTLSDKRKLKKVFALDNGQHLC